VNAPKEAIHFAASEWAAPAASTAGQIEELVTQYLQAVPMGEFLTEEEINIW
jgi:hypothetical protein